MCEMISAALVMAATGAQAILGAAQQAQQASVQQGNALYQAALARNAASVSEFQAQDAEGRASVEEENRRRKTALALGAQQARFAAQGSDLSGSPLDLLGDTAAAGELEALSLRYQGEREAWMQRIQAANQRAQAGLYDATAANIDPGFGMANSLLGGFSSMVQTSDKAGFFKSKKQTSPSSSGPIPVYEVR